MMTRQCGQPHDHGEIKQQEKLSEYCCKLIARIVAEMSTSATSIRVSVSRQIDYMFWGIRWVV